MPIYDYNCSACAHVVEVIHGIHDEGPRFCPNCGVEGSMRKGFTTPAVHFKGSGWAKKDRSATASPGGSRPAKSSGGDATATASTSGGTGDASTSSAGSSASTTTSTASATSTGAGDD